MAITAQSLAVTYTSTATAANTLSAVLYSDDTWLETVARRFVIYLVPANAPLSSRATYEAMAQALVNAGVYVYLAFSWNQDTSSKRAMNLNNQVNGRVDYLSSIGSQVDVLATHISYVNTNHSTKITGKIILASQYEGVATLLAWSSDATRTTNHALVESIVGLGMELGVTNNSFIDLEGGVQFLSSILPKTKHRCLFAYSLADLLTPPDYVELLRYSVNTTKAQYYVWLSQTESTQWMTNNPSLWVNLALSHHAATVPLMYDTTILTSGIA